MPIVDSHVHIWAADSAERPWPREAPDVPHRPQPWSAAEVLDLMDRNHVERAALAPVAWDGDRNDLILQAANVHPQRFAAICSLDLRSPRGPSTLLALARQPAVRGLRFTFHLPHQRTWLHDGTADWLWPAAEEAGIPLMLLPPGNLPAIATVAARHPSLRLTIDHLALVRTKVDDEAFEDLPALLALAEFPNVAVKATAVASYTTDDYPFRNLHPYLREVFDAFGPRRIFWGSDVSRLRCPYSQLVDLFVKELDFLDATDKELIMGRAFCEWVDWPL